MQVTNNTKTTTEQKSNDDDNDDDWERFQTGMTRRDRALEGRSKQSHSVHSPYFPEVITRERYRRFQLSA